MKSNISGFTLIEIILAIGLAAIMIPALAGALSFSIRVSSQGEKFTQASALAQEGLEAIHFLKNQEVGWTWGETPYDGIYQVENTGGIWSLIEVETLPSANPVPYTRTIQISHILRSIVSPYSICDDPCSDPTATNDDNTRKIISAVTWLEANGIQTVSYITYVTNH